METETDGFIPLTTFEVSRVEGILPGIGSVITSNLNQIAVKTIKNELASIVHELSSIGDSLQDVGSLYQVDELKFSLSLSAEGKISLIGELSTGITPSISITLKLRNNGG